MTRLKRRSALAVMAVLLTMGVQGASVASANHWEAGNPDQPNTWTHATPSSNLGQSTQVAVHGVGFNTSEQGYIYMCTATDPDSHECGWSALGSFNPANGAMWGPVNVTVPNTFAVAGQYGPGRTVDCRVEVCHLTTVARNYLGGHSLSFAP